MSLSPIEYLHHMLDEAIYIETNTSGLTQTAFMQSQTLQRAFVRSLEIIGEASKHVPTDFRARYQDVPWKEMAGIRDRLIHDYMAVDYEIVWDVISTEIPSLVSELEEIIEQLESTEE